MRPPITMALAATLLAAGCTAPPAAPTPPSRTAGRVEAGGDLGACRIPVLRSSYLEQRWGLPQVTTYRDGGYRLTFRQGTSLNYVFIHGFTTGEPEPAAPPPWQEEHFNDQGFAELIEHPQSWRHATILGRPVKWRQNDGGGGADFPCYKTVVFPLTAPDGRTGFYQVSVCAESEAMAADWLTRVGW